MRKETAWKVILFSLPFLVLFFLSFQNPLFWDTVQFASLHPSFYLETGFHQFLLPDAIDSGHPPTFGIYLAILWKFFGKSLIVSHFAMLPFILMIIYQAVKLGEHLFPRELKYSLFTTGIILSNCVLISQSTLVTPDILVIAFFLYAFNAVLRNKRIHLTFAAILLSALSMRAMMSVLCLYPFFIALGIQGTQKLKISILWHKVIPFIPGGLLALAFFTYHFLAKGWIGYHEDSTWASSFQRPPMPVVLKNFLILGWRMADLGNVFSVFSAIILGVLWALNTRNWIHPDRKPKAKALLILIFSLFIITAVPLCFYTGLLSHRYLLPLSLVISIFAVYLIVNMQVKAKSFWLTILVLVQLSGHFWTYPRFVSQGWDSTLAHLSVFKLREEFQNFMKENDIPKSLVGTAFPLKASDAQIDLKGDTTRYQDFHSSSIAYIWYSNVCNEMNKEIPFYFKNWIILKQRKEGNVEMVLFKKPNKSN